MVIQIANADVIITVSEAVAEVSVIPPAQRVNIGDSFNFSIYINPNTQPLSGAQLNLKYNGSVIKLNYISEGDFLKQRGASTYFNSGSINNTEGIVINVWAIILSTNNVSVPGTFITVNATAIGTGSTYINLSNVILATPESEAAPLSTVNQSITVSKSYDINGDWIIDILDMNAVGQHFGESTTYPYPSYDVNKDGNVNIFDALAVARHFGERY